MAIKSVLKPENSVVAAIATAGLVYGIYQLDVGSVSVVHATDAYDVNVKASLKKAGWTALIGVAAISLLAKDTNIAVLGSATIIAMQLHYRHAVMTHPDTGQLVPPTANDYQPAENVVPLPLQGENVSYG